MVRNFQLEAEDHREVGLGMEGDDDGDDEPDDEDEDRNFIRRMRALFGITPSAEIPTRAK